MAGANRFRRRYRLTSTTCDVFAFSAIQQNRWAASRDRVFSQEAFVIQRWYDYAGRVNSAIKTPARRTLVANLKSNPHALSDFS